MTRRAHRSDRLPAAAEGARKNLLARIHIMQKELALTDESYRDVLERVAGGRTAAAINTAKLYDVVKEFERLGAGRKSAGRPIAIHPMAWRCRALWRSLWNLDELDNPSEQALAAFVKRQTGKEDMRFCTAPELSTVIEALKDMADRAGVDLSGSRDLLVPKLALVREQWRRLEAVGWVKVRGDWGLAGFAHRTACIPNARTVEQMEAEHLDALANKLGAIVREKKLGRRRQEPA
jgi:hypothetical protein